MLLLTSLAAVGAVAYWYGLVYASRKMVLLSASLLLLIILGLLQADYITLPAVVLLLFLGLLCYGLKQSPSSIWLKIGWGVFIVISLTLGFRVLPFFTPVSVLIGAEQTFQFPPEKIVLILLVPPMVLTAWSAIKTGARSRQMLSNFWISGLIFLGIVCLTVPVGLLTEFIELGLTNTKTKLLIYFLIYNLLFTCVLEESFFRGIIQTAMVQFWSRYFAMHTAQIAGILIASLLFGIAHLGGGGWYVLLAGLAGLGYGLTYEMTGRLHYAVWVHFWVNTTQKLIFTSA